MMYKLPMCRICLIKDVRMHCLANTQLQEIFELLSGKLLETKDACMLHACYMCCARLRNCLRLRTACLHSEELFAHLLEKDSCEVTPSQDRRVQQAASVINMNMEPEIHRELNVEPLLTTDELQEDHVEGVPITFTQTSSQQMRSHWFVLDVVSTLPIFEFIGDGHFAGINKLLRLPKVFRVLKVIEDKYVYHSNLLRFCSYSLLLLIACYLIAAMQQGFMCYQ